MTLFGALSSGVSGLQAQSSAMGAISDNIVNVNTIGYKSTQVDFQTLVTAQSSTTLFSAGGVQSRPRSDTGVQGLLQASSSQTDLALSGSGFFVVNESNTPTISNEFLFTRAGSFFQDNQGFLRNTAGFYLQAWPTDANGNITPNNSNLTIPNLNVISTDFLTTVNLNRVGGTAAATSNIAIGANLPSNATTGQTHATDVQFFDTLGTARTLSFNYTRTFRDNEWDVDVTPPQGSSVLNLYADTAGATVYASRGQLEFSSRPADGSSVSVDGVTYQFDSTSTSVTPAGALTFDATADTITGTAGDFSSFNAGDIITITGTGSNNFNHRITNVSADGSTITVDTAAVPNQEVTVTAGITANETPSAGVVTIAYSSFTVSSTLRRVNVSTNTTLAQDVSTFVTTVRNFDSDYDTTNNRIQVNPGNSTGVLFVEDGSDDIVVDPSGLLTTAGLPAARQSTSFRVSQVNQTYADNLQLHFPGVPGTADTLAFNVNGTTYTFTFDGTDTTNDNDTNIRVDSVANMIADLEASMEALIPEFPSGSTALRGRAAAQTSDSSANDTLVIPKLALGSFTVTPSTGFTNLPTLPNSQTTSGTFTAQITAGTSNTIDVSRAVEFDSSGLPSAFNIQEMEVLGLENGAADFDDDTANTNRITLDFGTVGLADGVTQFGDEFTPVFITQDGSQFGTFAGVTVGTNGLVTALFDNGETRPVFQIPVATFVNTNALESRTGNVYNATQASGDPTLRIADNGPSGQVVQGSLEQSVVDIGEEFTDMIVVQRAFSAATRIISTTDEMLEELIRVRR